MRFRLLAGLLALSLLVVSAPPAVEGAELQVKESRPRIWLDSAKLASLTRQVEARSPTWQKLIAWAESPLRGDAAPKDGPGLALAALLLRKLQPNQARRLGRLAVACALAAARYGTVEKVAARTVAESKRRGAKDVLTNGGYKILVPDAAKKAAFEIDRFTPTRVFVKASGPKLSGATRPGALYLLLMGDMDRAGPRIAQAALTLDWAWEFFAPAERKATSAWLTAQARVFQDQGRGCFDSASAAALRFTALAALAAWGENPGARPLLHQALEERYRQEIKPCLVHAGEGGAWFEGDNLGAAAGLHLVEFAAAMQSAAGLDPARGVPWFRDRLSYLIFHILPGSEGASKDDFTVVPPGTGDRPSPPKEASDLVRLQMLILSDMGGRGRTAGWARALNPGLLRSHVSQGELLAREFIWQDHLAPEAPLAQAPLFHVASASGQAVSRSDWSGLGSWVSFNCGPHYAGAQHLAAGALQIFRREMLLAPGGVYDGYRTSQQMNYGVRSAAHNTILIPDPEEYSWFDMRAGPKPKGAYSNDGGQRAWAVFDSKGKPSAIAPWTASGWETGPAPWNNLRPVYDTARLAAHFEMPRFAYMRGDATAAYQGSTAKASRVVRHVFHLRPGGPQDAESVEVIAVIDDVSVARNSLSARFALHFKSKPIVPAGLKPLGPGRLAGPAGRLRVLTEHSRLDVIPLLPPNARLYLYGVPGQAASWVNGRNYPPQKPKQNQAPWLAEYEAPSGPQGRRTLLHCLLPADIEAPDPPEITRLTSLDADVTGLVVKDAVWPRVIALRLGEPRADAGMSYRYPGGRTRHLAAGLAPKTSYRVEAGPRTITISPGQGLTSSEAGTLAFEVVPRPPSAPKAAAAGNGPAR